MIWYLRDTVVFGLATEVDRQLIGQLTTTGSFLLYSESTNHRPRYNSTLHILNHIGYTSGTVKDVSLGIKVLKLASSRGVTNSLHSLQYNHILFPFFSSLYLCCIL